MRIIATIAAALLFAAAAYAMVTLRHRIRDRSPGPRWLPVAGVLCLLIFIAVNVSDWPGTVLADFWSQHAIFAATASTLPLVGVGYFIFETREQAERGRQERLDRSVAATGRGGVVDHLVDVDTMLSLLGWDYDRVKKQWPHFEVPSRPLRWLRYDRHLLNRRPDGTPSEADPRGKPLIQPIARDEWRLASSTRECDASWLG